MSQTQKTYIIIGKRVKMECTYFFLASEVVARTEEGARQDKPISWLLGTGGGRILLLGYQPGIPGGHGTSSDRSTGDGLTDGELKFDLLGLQWRGQEPGSEGAFPYKGSHWSWFSACCFHSFAWNALTGWLESGAGWGDRAPKNDFKIFPQVRVALFT